MGVDGQKNEKKENGKNKEMKKMGRVILREENG